MYVYDKSETSVLHEMLAGEAGSMRPRKCASLNFPCAALCCVVLLVVAGAEREVCLGGQGRASDECTPAVKPETLFLCAWDAMAEDTSVVSTCL